MEWQKGISNGLAMTSIHLLFMVLLYSVKIVYQECFYYTSNVFHILSWSLMEKVALRKCKAKYKWTKNRKSGSWWWTEEKQYWIISQVVSMILKVSESYWLEFDMRRLLAIIPQCEDHWLTTMFFHSWLFFQSIFSVEIWLHSLSL